MVLCAVCCEPAQDSWTVWWIRGKKLYTVQFLAQTDKTKLNQFFSQSHESH